MFIGHFAVALAAKKIAPKISLGTLFLSVSLVDLIWPIFLILGIEHVRIAPGITETVPLDFYDYPFTHSLLTSLGWSLLAFALYYVIKKDVRSSLIVGLAVFSHWILDFVTHRPDLPLTPGDSLKVGLGLWNIPAAAIIIELLMFLAAWYVYARATDARNRSGRIAFWSWTIFIVMIHFANLFGPPPPNTTALAYGALAGWLFVPWGYWIDYQRTSVTLTPSS